MSHSTYADEGTIAHALAALCLTENKDAAAYIGRILESEDYEHASLSPSGAHRWMRCPGSHALEAETPFVPRKFSMEVTEDMARDVQVYVDAAREYIKAAGPNAIWYVEQRLPIGHITGEEGATGSGDLVIVDVDHQEIQTHDLKFGRGVEVEAEGNEQLPMYLLGALEEFGLLGEFQRGRGVIHQPRINPAPKEAVWSLADLGEFRRECEVRAKHARVGKECVVHWHNDPTSTYLVPGEKQCKFCDAKARCPALGRLVSETVLGDFEALGDPAQAKPAVVPIPADADRLAVYLKRLPLIEAWCSAIAGHAEAELLAGRPVPGFKLVQGRRGARKWANETDAEAAMKAMRLKHDEMYDYSVISPTTAEKRLAKDHPRQWKKLESLITQADGKPTVVPESDKRPALEIRPVEDDFSVVSEEHGEALV